MGSRRNYFPSQFEIESPNSIDHRFEFHESDLWNSDGTALKETPVRSSWKKSSARKTPSVSSNSSFSRPISSSLPVNIPDWSKILGTRGRGGEDQDADIGGREADDEDDDDDDDDEEEVVPPHEYAARQVARRSGMVVAFSVHEGIGRTLKGRDLSRVRNAIWKQTGFED